MGHWRQLFSVLLGADRGLTSNTVLANESTFYMSSVAMTRVTSSGPSKIGEYRSYLRNANAQTFTETSGNPTAVPSTADGFKAYSGNTYTSADTANSPTRYEIFIGRYKAYQVYFFRSTGKTGASCCGDPIPGTNDAGYWQHYDPATGILTLSAFRGTGGTSGHVALTDGTGASVGVGYFDVLVGNSPSALEVQTLYNEYNAGNSSTALTLNLRNGNAQKIVLTGNCTFTFSNPSVGYPYVLRLVQDGTGSRTVTWPANVKWPGGTAPTLTTTASATDLVNIYYDGTNYYGSSALGYT
jgi:hypothetical protein